MPGSTPISKSSVNAGPLAPERTTRYVNPSVLPPIFRASPTPKNSGHVILEIPSVPVLPPIAAATAARTAPAPSRHFTIDIHPDGFDFTSWDGYEKKRAAPCSFGRIDDLYENDTLEMLRTLVDFRDIRARTPPSRYRSVSPAKNAGAQPPPAFTQHFPAARTAVVSFVPLEIEVTHEQAKVLLLMQGIISAARSRIPNAGNQLPDLFRTKLRSGEAAAAGQRMAGTIAADPRIPATRKAMARTIGAAMYAAGNCTELSNMCFHMLGATKELQPYQIEVLGSSSVDHVLVVAHVGGRKLICDAWPTYAMSATEEALLPEYRRAFLQASPGAPQPTLMAAKKPGDIFPAFPALELKTLEPVANAAWRRANIADPFGYGTAAYLDRARPKVQSVPYGANPGAEYVVRGSAAVAAGGPPAGEQRFNTRFHFNGVR